MATEEQINAQIGNATRELAPGTTWRYNEPGDGYYLSRMDGRSSTATNRVGNYGESHRTGEQPDTYRLMKWRYLIGYCALIAVVVWGCSGCSFTKTNIEYQCFTKAACD